MTLPQPSLIKFRRIRKSILKKSGVDTPTPVHPVALLLVAGHEIWLELSYRYFLLRYLLFYLRFGILAIMHNWAKLEENCDTRDQIHHISCMPETRLGNFVAHTQPGHSGHAWADFIKNIFLKLHYLVWYFESLTSLLLNTRDKMHFSFSNQEILWIEIR